jgi:hypothetical protein
MMWQDGMIAFLVVWLVFLAFFRFADSTPILLTGAAIFGLLLWRFARGSRNHEDLPYRHDMGLYAE